MSGVLDRLGRFTTENRAAVIAVYALVSILLAWRSTTIHLDTALTDLLPRGTASADDLRDLIDSDETLDRLFISLWREPAGEDPDEDVAALSSAAEKIAGSLDASGLVRGVRYGVSEEEVAAMVRSGITHLPVLLDPSRAPEAALKLDKRRVREAVAAIRERATMPGFAGLVENLASRDPLGLLSLLRPPRGAPGGVRPDPETGLFLSEDGRRLLIVVEAARPPTEVTFSRRLVDAADAAVLSARGEGPEGRRLRSDLAGGHIFALEDEKRVRHDASVTSLLSIAGVALVYVFVVRRPALWLAILVPLVMSTVWTLGLASIYPGRLNMITVAFAAILLGIGDDAMLHMYLREREERRRGARAPRSAAIAFAATGTAVIVATLTTAAAFFALSFVRFRGLAELGVIAAMGMINLLAGVLLFFPAALALLAAREERAPKPSLRLPVAALLAIHDWSAARRRAVLAGAAALTLLMLAAASGVRVTTDLKSIRGADPAETALRRVLAPFGNAAAAETMVVIHDGRSLAADIERGLAAAEALLPLCDEMTASGRITGCDSPALTTPAESIQRARFEADSVLPWAGAVETLVAEARAQGIKETFFAPFLDAARRYGEFGAVRIPADPSSFGALGVPRTTIFFPRASDAPAIAVEIRGRLAGFPTRIASIGLVSADLSRIISEDFGRAAWLVAAAIAILAFAAFRSVKLFLLTVTPVVIGCVFMLGAIRLAGVELTLMSLMGLPIVFGLGVDYGVYFVDRWSREKESPRDVLAGVGPSMLVTGLTTLAGFASLLAADLAGLRSLGAAVLLGTGFTLAAAILILPLMLPAKGR
jgi:uncharacterized protein